MTRRKKGERTTLSATARAALERTRRARAEIDASLEGYVDEYPDLLVVDRRGRPRKRRPR